MRVLTSLLLLYTPWVRRAPGHVSRLRDHRHPKGTLWFDRPRHQDSTDSPDPNPPLSDFFKEIRGLSDDGRGRDSRVTVEDRRDVSRTFTRSCRPLFTRFLSLKYEKQNLSACSLSIV